ncbi:MAG: hypothetical protein K0M70_05900 [Arenimonas sp.]|uniref:hypothetical protein n=1 Tax=Arenimonas sp. TaxID=1872635 RepID=UPI0025C06E0F|nr:hypothetical protein [Arenimonas sp.]MBW8367373.1 hypothetical protein [Arenimonas sp.]
MRLSPLFAAGLPFASALAAAPSVRTADSPREAVIWADAKYAAAPDAAQPRVLRR